MAFTQAQIRIIAEVLWNDVKGQQAIAEFEASHGIMEEDDDAIIEYQKQKYQQFQLKNRLQGPKSSLLSKNYWDVLALEENTAVDEDAEESENESEAPSQMKSEYQDREWISLMALSLSEVISSLPDPQINTIFFSRQDPHFSKLFSKIYESEAEPIKFTIFANENGKSVTIVDNKGITNAAFNKGKVYFSREGKEGVDFLTYIQHRPVNVDAFLASTQGDDELQRESKIGRQPQGLKKEKQTDEAGEVAKCDVVSKSRMPNSEEEELLERLSSLTLAKSRGLEKYHNGQQYKRGPRFNKNRGDEAESLVLACLSSKLTTPSLPLYQKHKKKGEKVTVSKPRYVGKEKRKCGWR